MVRFMEAEGLVWGGDWHSIKDYPHFQLSTIPVSPSAADRLAYARHGLPGLRAGQLMDRWAEKTDEDASTPFTLAPDRPVARTPERSGKITN